MKLWDEPESSRAIPVVLPMDTCTFMVWQPRARTPKIAWREMPGVSSVAEMVAAVGFVSASSNPTISMTKSFLQR